MRKTLYLQYSKFQKGHTSFKNWHLIGGTVQQSHMQKNMFKHIGEKGYTGVEISAILAFSLEKCQIH